MGFFEKSFFKRKPKEVKEDASSKQENAFQPSASDPKWNKMMSRREFLRLSGNAALVAGTAMHAAKNAPNLKKAYNLLNPSDPAEIEKREKERIREMAQTLPAKVIERSDFPLDEEKFSQCFDIINEISREKTKIVKENGKVEPGWDLITISLDHFNRIFFSQAFQRILKSRVGTMTYMNAISLVQATERALERYFAEGNNRREGWSDLLMKEENKKAEHAALARKQQPSNLKTLSTTIQNSEKEILALSGKLDGLIEDAAMEILGNIDQVRDRELFGPNTNLILFCHEEPDFDNTKLKKHLFQAFGGKDSKILSNEKGEVPVSQNAMQLAIDGWHRQHPNLTQNPEYLEKLMGNKEKVNISKIKTLYSIACCEGNTTILFSGHGSPEKWSFSENKSDNLDRNTKPHSAAISYVELGDALIKSGNIENINLIGATCYAYDYLQNLFSYLENVRGVTEKPYVSISAANLSKVSWKKRGEHKINNELLAAMTEAASDNDDSTITAKHFFLAEGKVWKLEDPAIFIGSYEDSELDVEAYNRDKLSSVDANRPKRSQTLSGKKLPTAKRYLELGSVQKSGSSPQVRTSSFA